MRTRSQDVFYGRDIVTTLSQNGRNIHGQNGWKAFSHANVLDLLLA
jgi:hypothetical protein